MLKKKIIALLLMAMPFGLSAQEAVDDGVISADRPGISTGTDVMPQGRWQWEQGFSYEADKTSGSTIHKVNFSNTLLRFGLSRNAELRLQVDGLYMKDDWESITGLCPIVVGSKIKVHESQNAIPNVALLANLVIPCGKREFRADNIAPQLYALFSNDLNDQLNLSYNVGLEWDGEDAAPTTFVALCLGYSPTDNVGVFAEGYGYMHKHTSAQWYMDGGVNWIVTPRVQLDLSGGVLLSHFGKDLFVAVGVSWLM